MKRNSNFIGLRSFGSRPIFRSVMRLFICAAAINTKTKGSRKIHIGCALHSLKYHSEIESRDHGRNQDSNESQSRLFAGRDQLVASSASRDQLVTTRCSRDELVAINISTTWSQLSWLLPWARLFIPL